MMGAFLMGCDTIQKRNLRRGSIGDSISHTGKKIGSKTSIPIKSDHRLKSRRILGLQTHQSYSGFANTISLVEPLVRLAKSRNGGVSEKKIRCMEGAGIRVQDGKAVAPRNDNLFIYRSGVMRGTGRPRTLGRGWSPPPSSCTAPITH